jgi:malate permease and related proteins
LVIVHQGQGGLRQGFIAMLKEPVVYAMGFSVALLMTHTVLPRWLGNTVDLLGGIAIPLMSIALGVSLASFRVQSLWRSIVLSLVRVLGGLLIGYWVAWQLDLTGVTRAVVILQSAMPVAVFNYLLAERYHCNPKEVAAMVIVSTVIALIGLPFLLATLL